MSNANQKFIDKKAYFQNLIEVYAKYTYHIFS